MPAGRVGRTPRGRPGDHPTLFAPTGRRRFLGRRKDACATSACTCDAGRTSRTDSAWSPRRPPYAVDAQASRQFLRPLGAGVLKHERFHGFRTARCATAGASPVATVRRPVGAKNGSYKACPLVASWRLCVRSPAMPLFSFSLCILHSAFCILHSALRFPVLVPCPGNGGLGTPPGATLNAYPDPPRGLPAAGAVMRHSLRGGSPSVFSVTCR